MIHSDRFRKIYRTSDRNEEGNVPSSFFRYEYGCDRTISVFSVLDRECSPAHQFQTFPDIYNGGVWLVVISGIVDTGTCVFNDDDTSQNR